MLEGQLFRILSNQKHLVWVMQAKTYNYNPCEIRQLGYIAQSTSLNRHIRDTFNIHVDIFLDAICAIIDPFIDL